MGRGVFGPFGLIQKIPPGGGSESCRVPRHDSERCMHYLTIYYPRAAHRNESWRWKPSSLAREHMYFHLLIQSFSVESGTTRTTRKKLRNEKEAP